MLPGDLHEGATRLARAANEELGRLPEPARRAEALGRWWTEAAGLGWSTLFLPETHGGGWRLRRGSGCAGRGGRRAMRCRCRWPSSAACCPSYSPRRRPRGWSRSWRRTPASARCSAPTRTGSPGATAPPRGGTRTGRCLLSGAARGVPILAAPHRLSARLPAGRRGGADPGAGRRVARGAATPRADGRAPGCGPRLRRRATSGRRPSGAWPRRGGADRRGAGARCPAHGRGGGGGAGFGDRAGDRLPVGAPAVRGAVVEPAGVAPQGGRDLRHLRDAAGAGPARPARDGSGRRLARGGAAQAAGRPSSEGGRRKTIVQPPPAAWA